VASGASANGKGLEDAIDCCLSLFYYWVNFGPLSRGTAACGYGVLLALLTALDLRVSLPFLPRQKQLDWEAILRPTPRSFIDHVRPWLRPRLASAKGDVLGGLASVDETLPTLRHAIEALNAQGFA
jgi:hypothetical protein